ncbi:type II toxin-antitoxin system HicA family toxin [Oceanicoccus sagamiensis]|uniref:Addiction module toxin, HicA family n=1 Tax=Oceanicoccus sagamiensis TaxID=716816 RepID=A0A1X9NDW3_9GAMM|nr:type II toxin-antitoxin system HicA family toxin [Oceanicoccus sagamiensis]ARN75331.1 hypothetical protein BST96_15145 [Oceanicoccus sagamiensis]
MPTGHGWRRVSMTGSHHHFKYPAQPGLVAVLHPKKDLPAGTVKSIIKQAGLFLPQRYLTTPRRRLS